MPLPKPGEFFRAWQPEPMTTTPAAGVRGVMISCRRILLHSTIA